MKIFLFTLVVMFNASVVAHEYERNKAMTVQQVVFGQVQSVRHISETEIIEDRNNGWKTFGGALLGGVIGHQFGSGRGRDIATVLGAIIGGSAAQDNNPKYREKVIRLVELMIKTEKGDIFMVVQDYDPAMTFKAKDDIRMIYLTNGSVRIDQQM